jgi:hypothetical protein
MDRFIPFKGRVSSNPLYTDLPSVGEVYPNPIYLDDVVTSPNTLATKDFFIFPIFSSISSLDDSYEVFKFLNYLYASTDKVLVLSSNGGLAAHTHFYVFDFFRPDSDEFS